MWNEGQGVGVSESGVRSREFKATVVGGIGWYHIYKIKPSPGFLNLKWAGNGPLKIK